MSDWGPSVLGAAGSVFGNALSGYFSSINVDKQLDAQRKENQLNRDFNSREAQKNRLFQSAQIRSYREYNSPANQARLMQEAGYHPLTAMGQFGQIDAGTTSGAQASSSGGISPVGYTPPDFGEAALVASQAHLNNSAANKNNSEANKLDIEASTESLMQSGNLALQNLDILAKKISNESAAADLAYKARTLDNRISMIKQNLDNLVQTGKNLSKQGRLLTDQHLLNNLEYQFQSQTFQDRVKHQAAVSDISVAEAKIIDQKLALDLLSMSAGIQLSNAQSYQAKWMGNYMRNERNIHSFKFNEELRGLKLVNDKFAFDFGIQQDTAEIDKWIGVVDRGFQTLADGINLKNLLYGGRGRYSHSLSPTQYQSSYR